MDMHEYHLTVNVLGNRCLISTDTGGQLSATDIAIRTASSSIVLSHIRSNGTITFTSVWV